MTANSSDPQREARRKQAHTAIHDALAASWTEWRRTGRRPDFSKAAEHAMDGLGDLAAEILADQTMMRGLTIENGIVTLEAEPAREILLTLVASMRQMLDGYGAENYLETEISAPSVSLDLQDGQNPVDSYTVTIQRRRRPTPHEFRQQAEAVITRALAECDVLDGAVHGMDPFALAGRREAVSRIRQALTGVRDG
ncbi:hypothetical protein [Streptomyces sp. NPDC018584]|uniref:hypothetical protein n=1 Tax=unclassified Streptomyces TaxID=2593676 RepID=UPI00379ABE16